MKTRNAVLLTAIGFLFIAAGLILLKNPALFSESLRTLPYLCIGLGCGIFGHGLGELISRWTLRNNPEIHKQMQIDQQDERNQMIADKAKGKAYDAMLYVFGALMVTYALMNADLFVILTFVAAYLCVVGISIYYRLQFDKKM